MIRFQHIQNLRIKHYSIIKTVCLFYELENYNLPFVVLMILISGAATNGVNFSGR